MNGPMTIQPHSWDGKYESTDFGRNDGYDLVRFSESNRRYREIFNEMAEEFCESQNELRNVNDGRVFDVEETQDSDDYIYLLLDFMNDPVGFCTVYPDTDDNVLCLTAIYVRERHRRKGLAEDMVKYVIMLARLWNLDHIVLGVVPNNPIKHLFDKVGFETFHQSMCLNVNEPEETE